MFRGYLSFWFDEQGSLSFGMVFIQLITFELNFLGHYFALQFFFDLAFETKLDTFTPNSQR